MHLELYIVTYTVREILKHLKEKILLASCRTVFVAVDYDRLEKYLLRILSRRKKQHFFDSGVYIWLNSQNRGLATCILQTLRKKPKRLNKFKAKIPATQESFQRAKRCIEVWSFVLAQGPRLLWKKRFMKIRFVHVDFFFFFQKKKKSL